MKSPRATPSVEQAEARRRSMPRPVPGKDEQVLETENQGEDRGDARDRTPYQARGHITGDEPWLRYAGAAAAIGVSRGTLEVWLSTKRYLVPHYKIGRNVLFKRSELQAWLESRRRGGDTA